MELDLAWQYLLRVKKYFYEQHPFRMFFQTNKWICSTQLSHNLFPSVELFTEIISSISYGLLQSVRPGFHDLTISFPLLMALKTYLRSFSITLWLAASDLRRIELDSKIENPYSVIINKTLAGTFSISYKFCSYKSIEDL